MKYTDENRGAIQYPKRARQIIDFSGLRYGNITPTDIDGFFEVHNNIYFYYEFKYKNANMSIGQYAALLRQVDTDRAAGKEAVLIYCKHNIKDTSKAVDAASTPVVKYYYNGKWWSGKGRTAKEITDKFYEHFMKG